MKRLTNAAALALLALVAGQATAEDPNLARNLVANCANCHGTNGKAIPGAGMEPLAGESKEKLVQKFKEYRSGIRPATVMHQIAKGYTDEQIDIIAAYLAAQQR